YAQEMTRARAPQPANGLGISIVGPTLMHHGTEEQKKRYIPKILNADEIWCQGFSEPNSGSDLASLQTKAVLDGDDFVVNGQKIWTSLGQYADWCILLVRVKQHLDGMIEYARTTRRNGHTLSHDPVFRQNLAQAYIRVEIMVLNLYRGITSRLRGQPPGPEASLDKLYWSEMDKWMQEL